MFLIFSGTGIQRGNAFVGFKGDKLSPGWASIPNAYRMDPEDQTFLPKIPAQPIALWAGSIETFGLLVLSDTKWSLKHISDDYLQH